MASLYKKVISGKPYYYLREMGWVDGKPRMVSERYLGSVADIVKAMDAAEAGMMPQRTGHLAFGDVAAVWSLITDLDVPAVIDEVVGARRSDAGASIGTYLALAALGRLVAPRSKKAFADWWAGTAGDRFTRISGKVLDHRKFWDAMHAVDAAALQDISTRLAARMIEMFDLDTSSVALDMTNFATYIDTTNSRAPIAQRRESETETHRPATGRPGDGRHQGRGDPAGLARLPREPARRHPVPHPDRPPRPPLRRSARQQHDHRSER